MVTEKFAAMCKENGVDGVILPDVPLEEALTIVDVMREAGLRTCLLVAPTTPAGRREAIARLCDGFVYYLSVSGITGERKRAANLAENVAALKKVSQVPVCVGFGISSAEQVREVTAVGANGAIVGSAVIRRIEFAKESVEKQAEAVRKLVAELAGGLG